MARLKIRAKHDSCNSSYSSTHSCIQFPRPEVLLDSRLSFTLVVWSQSNSQSHKLGFIFVQSSRSGWEKAIIRLQQDHSAWQSPLFSLQLSQQTDVPRRRLSRHLESIKQVATHVPVSVNTESNHNKTIMINLIKPSELSILLSKRTSIQLALLRCAFEIGQIQILQGHLLLAYAVKSLAKGGNCWWHFWCLQNPRQKSWNRFCVRHLSRPFCEPVDGAAIHQGWEHAQTSAR